MLEKQLVLFQVIGIPKPLQKPGMFPQLAAWQKGCLLLSNYHDPMHKNLRAVDHDFYLSVQFYSGICRKRTNFLFTTITTLFDLGIHSLYDWFKKNSILFLYWLLENAVGCTPTYYFTLFIVVLSTLEKVNTWAILICAINKCTSLWHLLNIVQTFFKFDFNFSTEFHHVSAKMKLSTSSSDSCP